MNTVFIVGQHGNEKLPIEAVQQFDKNIGYIVANPKAVKGNVRFIETDLNRSFPGNENGKYEEGLASKLLKKIKKTESVIDIHTATCGTPLFAIVTKVTSRHLNLVRKLGIRKVVYMENSIASGRALIDHVKIGVSIEAGREKTRSVLNRIMRVLKYFLSEKIMSEDKLEIYSVFKIVDKTEKANKLFAGIRNFKKFNFLGEEVYPILAREKSYPKVFCLLAHKVNIDSIILN